MTAIATDHDRADEGIAGHSFTDDEPTVYPYVVRGIDPRTLRAEGNSREIHDIREQRPELVASIAEHGMNSKISMINVAPDPDGVLGVLVGFSRTAACIAVKEQENPDLTIDVLVHEPGTTRQDVLFAQGVENLVRKGYSPAEEAGLYQQLALEGVDDDTIATKLVRPVERVRAGRAIAANARTHAASNTLPDVDLLTLASLAEFADNESAHQSLVDTLHTAPHNFEHKLGQLRKQRERRAILADEAQRLTELGYTIIDDEDDLPDGVARLDQLCSDADDAPLDPDAHVDCPGRAATIYVDFWLKVRVTELCSDYPAHGHRTIASARIATAEAQLEADGVPVIDPDTDGATELSDLFADETAEHTLTAEDHAACPGHAAYVEHEPYQSTVDVHYVCTDPAAHGHVLQNSLTPRPEQDSAWKAAEIKRASENNKQWREAKEARRAWLATYFTGWRKRKAADLPPRVHHWLALAPILASDHLDEAAPAHRYACALLKLGEPTGNERDGNPIAVLLRKKNTSETQAVYVRLAQVIGACEEHWDRAYTDKNADATWRSPSDDSRFYFELLDALGYPLEHVEQLINNPDLDNERWPHLAPETTDIAQAA